MPTITCENINRKIPAEPGERLLTALEREGVRVYRFPWNYLRSKVGSTVVVLAVLVLNASLNPCEGWSKVFTIVLLAGLFVYWVVASQVDWSFVEVKDGMDQISEKTGRERKQLRNSPEGYRLASQCYVHGDLTIVTRPKEEIVEDTW